MASTVTSMPDCLLFRIHRSSQDTFNGTYKKCLLEVTFQRLLMNCYMKVN